MISTIIIHPNPEERQKEMEKLLLEAGFKKEHPDLFWLGEEEKLGIEQIRQIQQFLSLKPYQAKGQAIVLLSADNLTLDAQNAFLKTLEESPENSLIILGAQNEESFLPTILSRCHIIYLEKSSPETQKLSEKQTQEIEDLLKAPLEERFLFIEKLKEKEGFLKILVVYFRNKLHHSPHEYSHFLRDLLQAEKWDSQNLNIRAILEHLMLKMPQLDSR